LHVPDARHVPLRERRPHRLRARLLRRADDPPPAGDLVTPRRRCRYDHRQAHASHEPASGRIPGARSGCAAGVAFGRNVHYLLAARSHSVTNGTADSEAIRTLVAFGLPPMCRSWPVNTIRNALVRARFNASPTTLVTKNIEYCARRLACPRARNVQRRFQTNPLVTARQKEMVALIHHGVRGAI